MITREMPEGLIDTNSCSWEKHQEASLKPINQS